MRRLLKEATKLYDIVLIDTSPAINEFVLFIIQNSHTLLIPSTPEKQAINSMENVLEALPQLNLMSSLEVITLWTRFNARSGLHTQANDYWTQLIKQFQKQNKQAKLYHYKGFISNSIKNESSVAYEKLPLSFVKAKSKNKDEYEALYKYIISKKK